MSAPEWMHPSVLQRIRTLIGLESVVADDALHADLAKAVFELGPGASDGAVLQRCRWHFVWHLRDAGQRFARAKADYEHAVASRKVREMASPQADGRRMSLGWAEAIAEAEAYDHKLAYLQASASEQAMRKTLDAIDSAVELFRTQRADERAADHAHAQGIGGAA